MEQLEFPVVLLVLHPFSHLLISSGRGKSLDFSVPVCLESAVSHCSLPSPQSCGDPAEPGDSRVAPRVHRRSNSCSSISVASCVLEWEQRGPSCEPASIPKPRNKAGAEPGSAWPSPARRRGMCWNRVLEVPRDREELEQEEDPCCRVSPGLVGLSPALQFSAFQPGLKVPCP